MYHFYSVNLYIFIQLLSLSVLFGRVLRLVCSQLLCNEKVSWDNKTCLSE